MNKAITITIGRNVDSEPMHTEAWDLFRHVVGSWFEDLASEVWINGNTGRGEWKDAAGTVYHEDNAVWFGLVPGDQIDELRRAIATIRGNFNQDAAGFAVGDSTLI